MREGEGGDGEGRDWVGGFSVKELATRCRKLTQER